MTPTTQPSNSATAWRLGSSAAKPAMPGPMARAGSAPRSTSAPVSAPVKAAHPAVPIPMPVAYPVPPRTLHVEGSLKDSLPDSRPPGGPQTITTSGSLALTSFQGTVPGPAPAFLSHPILEGASAGGAWSREWLENIGDKARQGQ